MNGVMLYTLIRTKQDEQGTFGELYAPDGTKLCVTVEPPPTGDHPCIPSGMYNCIPHNGDHWKNVWEITDVPGRSAILIHAGNFGDKDTQGCVVVGTTIGAIGDHEAVLQSLVALNKLRSVLPDKFMLSVLNPED